MSFNYEFWIDTGDVDGAGTDAQVSFAFRDANNNVMEIIGFFESSPRAFERKTRTHCLMEGYSVNLMAEVKVIVSLGTPYGHRPDWYMSRFILQQTGTGTDIGKNFQRTYEGGWVGTDRPRTVVHDAALTTQDVESATGRAIQDDVKGAQE